MGSLDDIGMPLMTQRCNHARCLKTMTHQKKGVTKFGPAEVKQGPFFCSGCMKFSKKNDHVLQRGSSNWCRHCGKSRNLAGFQQKEVEEKLMNSDFIFDLEVYN